MNFKNRFTSVLISVVVLLFAGLLLYNIGQPEGFQEGVTPSTRKPIGKQVKATKPTTVKQVLPPPTKPKNTPIIKKQKRK